MYFFSAGGPHSAIGRDLDDDEDYDNDDDYNADCDDYMLCLSQWATLCQCEEWKQLPAGLDGKP